eukprot:m.316286 g.316286  ORF g.316286 m.316286 type:complete len:55 (-) comp55459_c1_seq3:175-339(-)
MLSWQATRPSTELPLATQRARVCAVSGDKFSSLEIWAPRHTRELRDLEAPRCMR